MYYFLYRDATNRVVFYECENIDLSLVVEACSIDHGSGSHCIYT
jgi:hypothetical protein